MMLSKTFAAIGLSLAVANPVLADSQTTETLETRVHHFVIKPYIHGIPFEEARNLGAEALPVLERLLATEKLKSDWDHIVNTIAFIGDPKGYAILHRFIWSRFQGEIDLPTFQALISAQHFLGHIGASGDLALLRDLESGVAPAHWNALPWTYKHYKGQRLAVLWSKLTINAFSFTGNPRAVACLEGLLESPHSALQISNIEEGLQRLRTIAKIGLTAYEAQTYNARY